MTRALAVTAIIAAVLALYVLRLDHAAGLYVDDAWFIVLAKALAQQEGFALISSATGPILPAFPPGFPMLLAPLVWWSPDFPGHVPLLKSVSIAAMFGVGALSYFYLTRYRQVSSALAGAVAVLTVILPAFVFLATSTVMAEASFTLCQLGVAVSIERLAAASPGKDTSRRVLVAGAISVITLLVRAAGVAGIAAGVIYLATKRGVRVAALFLLLTIAGYTPWLMYSASHRPARDDRAAHGGSVSFAYSELLAMRYGGEPSGGNVTLLEIPGRVSFNLINIFGRDLGAIMFPAAYRGASESGQEVFNLSGEVGLRAGSMGLGRETVIVSSLLSAVAVAGFFAAARRRLTVAEYIVVATVAMVALVPARTYRYVLPLAPFVLFYFLNGVQALSSKFRRLADQPMTAATRIAALCMLILVGAEHAQYVWRASYGPPPDWIRGHQEVMSVIDWMNRNLSGDYTVVSTNPGLVYLMTGRKANAFTDPRNRWQRWRAQGFRYAVSLHDVEHPGPDLGYRVLFQAPRLRLWVIEIQPAAGDSN